MDERLILSFRDGLAVMSPRGETWLCAPLEGAGALCADAQHVFCADDGGTIWRFDRKSLMPQAPGCGGPGICSLLSSGGRLYALLGEADSVLMSDSRTGRPLVLNRCGCNPRNLSCCGNLLAVSGGERACVQLYRAQTLEAIGEIAMPGPVYSALLCGDAVYALCLTGEMNTWFAVFSNDRLSVIELPGMPGCLAADGGDILAAVQGGLYRYSQSCLLRIQDAPGRASRLIALSAWIVLYDQLSECVYCKERNGVWKRISCGVRDICPL